MKGFMQLNDGGGMKFTLSRLLKYRTFEQISRHAFVWNACSVSCQFGLGSAA